MKRLLSVFLSLSLTALSLGAAAPAALAQTVGASVKADVPTALITVLPAGNIGTGSLQSGAGLTSNALTPTLAVPTLSGIAKVPSITAPTAIVPTETQVEMTPIIERIYQTPTVKATAFAVSMQALSAPTLDSSKMDSDRSRDTAEKDFQARIDQSDVSGPSAQDSGDIELIVSAPEGSSKQLTADVYPVSLSRPGLGVQEVTLALHKQLQNLGISSQMLASHRAQAVGAVAKINTAVLKVSAASASILQLQLEAQGLQVQRGRIFKVPQPMSAEPESRTVGLKETAAIIGADKLQAELKKILGEPAGGNNKQDMQKMSLYSRAKAWLGRALGLAVNNPVLPWAILDTWVAVTHPYIQGHIEKSESNDPDSETHGSHTTGTVIGMDRWNYSGRNYNIFPGGSASEGDILFKLNKAQEDGALATTNSWGDEEGNPEGAIEKLFLKGAQQGLHHSISAGNSGSAPNTIGGPAIEYFNVDLTINGKVIGTVKRIKAIAAADADKKMAYFSSRGPGSKTTSSDPKYKDYPVKPDQTGMGVNLKAPVPSGNNVPELGGPGASMSGTSMSNPVSFGGFLLLTRAVLVLLKDYLPAMPSDQLTHFAMDLASYTMTQTAQKVAPAADAGDGFINVWSAFELAGKLLKENAHSKVMPKVRTFLRGVLGSGPAK